MKRLFFSILTKLGYRLESLDHRTIFGTDDFYNHWASRKSRKPVFLSNKPIPWITYPCLEYLLQLDMSRCSIFEYGAGHSTLWFAERAKEVTSVESDPQWYAYLEKGRPDNVTLIQSSEDQFAAAIDGKGKYDIILIDSHQRDECVDKVLQHLSEGGLVIFDNAERHPDSCARLREQGLLQVDFKGFGPVNRYTWCTSIFYSSLRPITPPLAQGQPSLCLGGEHTL